MTVEFQAKKKVRLRYIGGRFLFSYTLQLGDTVSEIAEELLGSAANIDVIQALNPSMDLSNVQADFELFIMPATPRAAKEFLDCAYSHAKSNAHVPEDENLPAIPFTIITEDLLAGRYLGYMP